MLRPLYLILFVLVLGCGPSQQEKQAALDAFLERDYEYQDTVLTYSFNDSSLTILFPSEPEYNSWLIEAWLVHKEMRKEIYLGNHTKAIINRQIRFNNFRIPEDSVNNYKILLFSCPISDDSYVISQPFSNIRAFWGRTDSVPGTLTPDEYWESLNFIRIHNKALDTLSPELVEYCTLQLLEEFKVSLPDE